MAYVDQNKYELAIAVLEHSLKLEANSRDAHWTLARAYYHQQNYDEALKESQQALNGSHGAAPDIELLLAQSLTAVGRYEDAGETLRSFLKNHPKDPSAGYAFSDRHPSSGQQGVVQTLRPAGNAIPCVALGFIGMRVSVKRRPKER